MDDTSGPIADRSGNADAVLVNGPTLGVDGQIGSAAVFTESQKAISSSPLGNLYTLSAWLKIISINTTFPWLITFANNSGKVIGISIRDNNRWQFTGDGRYYAFQGVPAPAEGGTYLIHWVFDGATYSAYINGQKITLPAFVGTGYTSGNIFTVNNAGGSSFSNGGNVRYDQVQHAPAAKSANWIAREYNNQSTFSTNGVFAFELRRKKSIFIPILINLVKRANA